MYINNHDLLYCIACCTVYSLTWNMSTFSSFNVLASFNPDRTVHHCLEVNTISNEHVSRGINRDFRELSGISVNDCCHFKTETESNTHGMVCSWLTSICTLNRVGDILKGPIHTKVVNKWDWRGGAGDMVNPKWPQTSVSFHCMINSPPIFIAILYYLQ